jgi:hypothetical protein
LAQIYLHIKIFYKLQTTRKDKRGSKTFVNPLPQCSEPNQRIHMNLFGPFKAMPCGKKFVLCVTDAFSKYAELVAIPDKSAPTVGQGFILRYLLRHGLLLKIVFNNGKEFCNEIVQILV